MLLGILTVSRQSKFSIRPSLLYMLTLIPSGGERTLWVTTWERIHKFLPGLQEELFPAPPMKTQSEPAVTEHVVQQPEMKKMSKSDYKVTGLKL